MNELTFAQTVALARDIVFLGVFVAAPTLVFLLYRKVAALVRTLGRVGERFQGMASTVSEEFVEPARTGQGRERARWRSPLGWVRRKR